MGNGHMRRKYLSFSLIIAIFFVSLTGCQSNWPIVNKDTSTLQTKTKVHQNKKFAPHTSTKNNVQMKIREYLILHHINGSVAVVKNGGIIFNEGFGYSNFKNGSKNQSFTTYPIGSITKVFVATSIMQLQEKGKLNILDPVSKYIPHFPNGKRIKLIHLLSHTSGIKNPIWHIGDRTPQDLIKEISKRHVTFKPGTKWKYRDGNYMVLGYIIEKVTGMSLHEYIERNIFDKANMGDSGFISQRNPIPYRSVGYLKQGKHQIPIKYFNIPFLFGCGDIYSTAYDLALFDQSLLNGQLVSEKSLKEMFVPRSRSQYGLGLYIDSNVVYSRGVLGGFESIHAAYKDKTNIAILLNVRDKENDIHKILDDIHKIVSTQKRLPTKG
jgi:teichoic acid D-alanine hydrolase